MKRPALPGVACKPHADLRASPSNAGHGKLRMQSRLPDTTMDTTQSLPHATHRDCHATLLTQSADGNRMRIYFTLPATVCFQPAR